MSVKPSINSIMTQPLRLLLFVLSFMMLQLCAFQMSAQAFGNGHMVVSLVALNEKAGENHQHDQSKQQHGKTNSACTVTNCAAPLPMPMLLKETMQFSHLMTVAPQQTLHGLPPVLSKRPPKSGFA